MFYIREPAQGKPVSGNPIIPSCEPKYQSYARDYREAVESLVHDHVRSSLTGLGSSARLCLVSRAYRHPYRMDAEVIAVAKRIGRETCEWIASA